MDAVGWHQQLGRQFEQGYDRSSAFKERLGVWSGLIERFGAPDVDVLDAGCGPGVLSAVAARRCRSVRGFDASTAMVELAQARAAREKVGNAVFEVARLGDPHILAGRSFGLVLCSSVLEYIDDLDAALDWLVSALTTGGVLVVSMPNGGSLYRRLERVVFRATGRPRYLAHVRHVPTPERFAGLLMARGLTVEERRTYAAAPFVGQPVRFLVGGERIDNLVVIAARRLV